MNMNPYCVPHGGKLPLRSAWLFVEYPLWSGIERGPGDSEVNDTVSTEGKLPDRLEWLTQPAPAIAETFTGKRVVVGRDQSRLWDTRRRAAEEENMN